MNGTKDRPKIALVMAGGGARAAYQVGVLKALAEFLPARAANPFPVICGTSAGAINAAAIAIFAPRFRYGVRQLLRVWRNFHVHQVFRADSAGLARTGSRWIAALALGGLGGGNPRALLDRAPLRELLGRLLPFELIQQSIDRGLVEALSITASGYYSGQSVSFFQAAPQVEAWRRARRVGTRTEITLDHLMASSAIPFVFEAVHVHREYFGDGSMRQIAPLSPAIHLGAERILVIGMRNEPPPDPGRESRAAYPSIGQIAGHVLSSIFLDALEADLERMQRINQTLRLLPPNAPHPELRPIDTLLIAPSRDPREIAERHRHEFPRPMRFLLRGIGAHGSRGADLASYLLFERPYCRELIDLGYADTLRQRGEVVRFLGLEADRGGA